MAQVDHVTATNQITCRVAMKILLVVIALAHAGQLEENVMLTKIRDDTLKEQLEKNGLNAIQIVKDKMIDNLVGNMLNPEDTTLGKSGQIISPVEKNLRSGPAVRRPTSWIKPAQGRTAARTASQISQAMTTRRDGTVELAPDDVAASAIDVMPKGEGGTPFLPYAKELKLLAHVQATATPGDPLSVCKAIEDFGSKVLGRTGMWLKTAGGTKTEVLTHALCTAPDEGSILEIGCYVGYSSLRMAMACPGARVVTLELDPTHVIIARNIHAFAGMSHRIDVWTGHSQDLLHRIHLQYEDKGGLMLRAIFMDQKGSRFDEDLQKLEDVGILAPGCVVIADNVLKPGAPVYLWQMTKSSKFDTRIVQVKEFAMPADDWMSISTIRNDLKNESMKFERIPNPGEITQLEWEADRIRQQATRGDRGVPFEEWAAFAKDMKARLRPFGVIETQEHLAGGSEEANGGTMALLDVIEASPKQANLQHYQQWLQDQIVTGETDTGFALLARADARGLVMHADKDTLGHALEKVDAERAKNKLVMSHLGAGQQKPEPDEINPFS